MPAHASRSGAIRAGASALAVAAGLMPAAVAAGQPSPLPTVTVTVPDAPPLAAPSPPPGPYPPRSTAGETVLTGAAARRSVQARAAAADLRTIQSATPASARAVLGCYEPRLATASDDELAFALGLMRTLPPAGRFARHVERVVIHGNEAEIFSGSEGNQTVVRVRMTNGRWKLSWVRRNP